MKETYLGLDTWDETSLKQLLQLLQSNSDYTLTLAYRNEQSMNDKITLLLLQMGIPSNLKGYSYLRTAIKLCVEDRSSIEGITKCLYPQIAQFFATSPNKVEHAMRHAIGKAWNDKGIQMRETLFGRTVGDKNKPTNSAFIATLTDYLLLGNSFKISS